MIAATERWLANKAAQRDSLAPEDLARLEHQEIAHQDDLKGERLAQQHADKTTPLFAFLESAPLAVATNRDAAPPCQSPGCKGRITGINIAPDGQPEKLAYWNRFCDPCVDRIKAAEEAKKLAANSRAQQDAWKTFGPEGAPDDEPNIYREADPARIHPLHKHHLDTIRDWNPYKGRGLILCGPTGEQKTMMLYLLARHLIQSRGIVPMLWTSPGLRHAFNKAARSDDLNERQRLMTRLLRVPVLMIDDLGQMAQSESAEEMLWELVEGRTSIKKPIATTTQFIGERFVAKFRSRPTGEAIIRRLGDYCQEMDFQPTH